MDVVLIAAVAANGVIGNDGEMPWHYPEDLKHFKETTMGSPVIAGRKTHESIVNRLGGSLSGRTSIVLTRNGIEEQSGVIESNSVESALNAAEGTGAEEVYVIGGATVYREFFDEADRMVLTEIQQSYEGDTEFPDWDQSDWMKVHSEMRGKLEFNEYERK